MIKAGIISQVRMTSTRLPGKVLLPVKNQPLLKYHTDRLRNSGLPVFLATTTNGTDDVIQQFAEVEKLGIYRGDENNVLSRFYQTALENKLEVIVRVTSDCPLIDGELIQKGVQEYLTISDENIYLSNVVNRTFPRGFDFEIFSFTSLQEAYQKADTTFQLEHVTPYIKLHTINQNILNPEDNSSFRITVDTGEDFELVKVLIQDYEAESLNHQEISTLLKNHPELVKINAHIEQKKY